MKNNGTICKLKIRVSSHPMADLEVTHRFHLWRWKAHCRFPM